jgi:class 3 adenylate cyclase
MTDSTARLARPSHTESPLDAHISAKLNGEFGSVFLSELFQGGGQLALMLLLLELVSEWPRVLLNPDPWLLLGVAMGQSAWLARARQRHVPLSGWSRLVGVGIYVLVESAVEGLRFFAAPHHLSFVVLSGLYAMGVAWEEGQPRGARAIVGTVVARLCQASGPVLYYIALDLHGSDWLAGVDGFLASSAHEFLVTLALAQGASLVALSLTSHRQTQVIEQLVSLLKQLSRWGYGDQVVNHVLRSGLTEGAQRAERVIAFIDVRGFTPWSESRPPEEVVQMLNTFYAAVLQGGGAAVIKTKMSGDEVLLVALPGQASTQAVCAALSAARQALGPWGLDAGAGLWQGPVVEGFFGAHDAQVHDVIGDTVNTAHRLCGQAGAGQLLRGPVQDDEPLAWGESAVWVDVKGKSQPVRALLSRVT